MKNLRLLTSLCIISIAIISIFYIAGKELNEEYENEEEENESESGAGQQLAMWWWSRAYPDPTDITGKYQEGWRQAEALKKNTAALFKRPVLTRIQGIDGIQGTSGVQGTSALGNWTAFGPKVFGGRILALSINKSLNAGGGRTIFAGSASGGIWRSYTGGIGATAWHPVVTNTPVLGVASIVYHPTDTSTLLAGTGEVYRVETLTNGTSTDQVSNIGRNVWKSRGTYGIGILKTSDAGKTWRNVLPKNSSALFGIQKIKYDPTNSNTVYACATDGLYRSADGGETWSNIWATTYVTDVVINPANNQMLVAAAGNFSNSNKGIYKSTNGGTSFTKVTSVLPTNFKGSTFLYFATGTTIFASMGSGNTNSSNAYADNEVYRSTDFGATWAVITNSNTSSNTNHSQFQSWFAHCLAPYPGSAGTTKLFMAGVKKYVLKISSATSTTGTVTSIGTGAALMSTYLAPGASEGTNYLHDDVHDIQFVPGSSSEAYFATDGGIFRTTNADATTISNISFSSCNSGLQVQQFYPTLAQSKTNDNLVLGGLQDNNVIRYNGTGWAKVVGGDGGSCLFKTDDETVVLGSRDTRAVYRSINSGSTFGGTPTLSYLGTVPVGYDDRTSFMSPIANTAANSSRIYAASDNFHVSTNSGTSFTYDAVSSMTNYIEDLHKPAIAIGTSATNAEKVYVSVSPFAQNINTDELYYTPPANLFKTTNAVNAGKATGKTPFTKITNGLPDRLITDIMVNPASDENVYITLGGFGTQHIYVTTDGGATWTPRGSGLPDVPFNTILIDPVNANIIYAGSDFGVYVSPDKGQNWYDYNNGLWDATYVMDLVVTPAGKLRAATHGKGIFESPLFQLTTLPVTTISFTGTARDNNNVLQWRVSEERNLAHYILERSADGGRFEPISNITAKNDERNLSYTFTDVNAVRSYYYRLKSVNDNGSYTYSTVIYLRKDNVRQGLIVLGNPFQNEINLQISTTGSGKVQLNLYDMKGALLRREEVAVTGSPLYYTIRNLFRYPSGIYQVEAIFNKQRWAQQLIKR